MTKVLALGAAIVVLGSLETLAQSARPGQGPVTIDIKGPVVIGFFQPFTQKEEETDDGGIREGLAHVRFALEDISKCYTNESAIYRLDVTRRVTLRDGRRTRQIRIASDWDHAVGLIFAIPGREPRVVFALGSPASLVVTGPMAASEYFGASACQK
jgi:hypothetical protein